MELDVRYMRISVLSWKFSLNLNSSKIKKYLKVKKEKKL